MGVLMPRSPVRTFSALIQAGRPSGPQRVVGAVTARRLIFYYTVVVALVSLVEFSLPLGPSGKARMLAPWLERMVLGAVTGTIVVESSLALAFSLTGIVAAVRFRNNLKDSRDALYIFAGIAIGFASGVYALDVAVAISLLFVLLELFAWRSGLGGDRANARAFLWGESRPAPAQQVTRSGRPLVPQTGSNGRGKQPREIVLRVETTDVDDAMRVVERVLGVMAKKWRLRGSRPNGGRTIVLEYECRLRRAYRPDSVRAQVLHQGVPFVRAAEWDR